MLYFSMNLPITHKHLNILVKSCIYVPFFISASILSFLFLTSLDRSLLILLDFLKNNQLYLFVCLVCNLLIPAFTFILSVLLSLVMS